MAHLFKARADVAAILIKLLYIILEDRNEKKLFCLNRAVAVVDVVVVVVVVAAVARWLPPV